MCKEITKIYENIISGTAQEIINHFDNNPSQLKGEFVLLIYKNINNKNNINNNDRSNLSNLSNIPNQYINISHAQLLNTLTKFLSSKESAKIAHDITGVPTKEIYNYIIHNNNHK